MNNKFEIQSIDSTRINILIYVINNYKNNKLIKLFDNNIQFIYNEIKLKSDINKNNISSNLLKINNNASSISTNLKKIDNFTQYILQSGKDFEEKYIIEKQIFRYLYCIK